MKNSDSRKFWLALVIFSLVGQVAWVVENMYFNVFIYKMFRASPEDISAMVSASAVAATVTTVLMGALADKLGKRKVFICGGYLCWGLSIMSFALLRMDVLAAAFPAVSAASLGISLTIIMDCVMTFFGSTANDACFNAWLTDSASQENRGAAEGVNAMMPLLAILVVFGGFMAFDLNQPSSWTAIYLIIGSAVLVIGVLGFFIIQEPKLSTKGNENYLKNLTYGFRPQVVRENKGLYKTLLSFALFGVSINIFMPYLILYYTEGLKMDNYVLLFAPAIILAAGFTAFYGRVYDKKGFAPAIIPAVVLLMAGYILLFFFKSTVPVFIGTLLMLCGYLAGSAIFGAMLRDQTPKNRSGMFQGQRIIGQVLLPGIIGPSIGSALLAGAQQTMGDDGVLQFIPNERIFLGALVAAAVMALSLLPLLKKKEAPV